MALPPTALGLGMAVFSTRNGKYAQRQAQPSMNVIIRSDPLDDRDTMTAKLIADFPSICKAINTIPPRVDDYFDGYDQELHGFEFLRAVLLHIAATNAAYRRRVQDYVRRWVAANEEAFSFLTQEHTFKHLFTEKDINEYGKDFLGDAIAEIKRFKDSDERNGATQKSLALQQQQHENWTGGNRNYVHSQSLIYNPLLNKSAVLQNLRVASHPEQRRGHTQQKSRPPTPQLQTASQQNRYASNHRFPPGVGTANVSTGDANPLSVSKSHVSLGIVHQPPFNTKHNTNIAYWGPPDSSGYGFPLHAPIPDCPPRSFDDNQSKGRKNPVKRSSDDVRRGSFEVDSGCQSFGRRLSSQLGTFQLVQSPQSMHSSVNSFNNPAQASSHPYNYVGGPTASNQNQRELSEYELAHMRDVKPCPAEYHPRPSAVGVRVNQHVLYATNQVRAQSDQMALQKASSTTPTYFPALVSQSQKLRRLEDKQTSKGQTSSAPSRSPELTGKPLNSYASGDQSSSAQISTTNNHSNISAIDNSLRSFVAHQSDVQPHQFSQSLNKLDSPRRDFNYLQSVRIWVGKIPSDANLHTVKEMLEPCQGLVNISEPRTTASQYESLNYAYVFVDFDSHNAAEEALKRIPRTQFPNLPEGKFLCANWPNKHRTTPSRYQQKDIVKSRRDVPQMSPTKARKAQSVEDVAFRGVERYIPSKPRQTVATTDKESTLLGVQNNMSVPITNDAAGMTLVECSVANLDASAQLLHSMSGSAELLTDGDDFGKRGGSPPAQNPQNQEPIQDQATKIPRNPNPSAVDGAVDSTPAVAASLARTEQKAQASDNRQRNDDHAQAPQAKQPSKKNKNKTKNKSVQLRVTKASEKSVGDQLSEAPHRSENIKPPKDQIKPTGKTFSYHEFDAAILHRARNVSQPSNVIDSSCASQGSEAQPSLDLLVMSTGSTERVHSTVVEQPQAQPVAKSSSAPGLSDQPHAHAVKKSREGVLEPTPTTFVPSLEHTTNIMDSKPTMTGVNMKEGPEIVSKAITRENGNSPYNKEDSTSCGPLSTVQTSYQQTERSNSNVDTSQEDTLNSTEPSSAKHHKDGGFDPEVLRSLLQADEATHDRLEDKGNLKSQEALVRVEQASTVSAQDLVQDKSSPSRTSGLLPRVSPMPCQLHGTDGPLPNETPLVNAKPVTTEEILISSSAKTARSNDTTTSPSPSASISEADNRNRSPDVLLRSSSPQSIPAPIQTRHKKRPKQLVSVKKGDVPDAEAHSAASGTQPDDPVPQIPKADVAPPSEMKPSMAQVKASKQRKRLKTRSKLGEPTESPTINSRLRTPSPDTSISLPKPETPFRTDGGIILPVPSVPTSTDKSHDDFHTVLLKDNAVVSSDPSKEAEDRITPVENSSSTSFRCSSPSNRPYSKYTIADAHSLSSAHGQEGLEAALEKAGYHSSRESISKRYVPSRDPCFLRLAQYQDIEVHMKTFESQEEGSSSKEFTDRVQDIRYQHDVRQVLERVAAARQSQAYSPPRTPTEYSSDRETRAEDNPSISKLEGEIEKIATHLISSKVIRGEKEIGESLGDREIERAKDLLDLSPRRSLSGEDADHWVHKASRFVEENSVIQASPLSTPTRKSKGSISRNSSFPPGFQSQANERSAQETSPLLDRPGSAIMVRPGAATAFVNLKPGEVASDIATQCLADPDAFFGSRRSPEHLPDSAPKSPYETNPAFDLVPTPPSPQTLGRRTPSEETKSHTPLLVMTRDPQQTTNNLERSLASVQATARKAIKHMSTDKQNRTSDGNHAQGPHCNVLSKPLDDSVVGYWGRNWGRNSDSRDLDIQYEVQMEREDKKEQKQAIDSGDLPSTSLQLTLENNRAEPNRREISMTDMAKGEVQVRPKQDNYATKHNIDEAIPLEEQQNKIRREDGAITASAGLPHDTECNLGDGDASTQPMTPKSPQTASLNIGPETASEAVQDVNLPTPETFGFGSESNGSAREKCQDDSEYPLLPRGGSGHTLKGGKNKSPTRGGYAAAAKMQAKLKGRKQETGSEEKKKSDGWVVAAEQAWGFGRRDGKDQRHEI